MMNNRMAMNRWRYIYIFCRSPLFCVKSFAHSLSSLSHSFLSYNSILLFKFGVRFSFVCFDIEQKSHHKHFLSNGCPSCWRYERKMNSMWYIGMWVSTDARERDVRWWKKWSQRLSENTKQQYFRIVCPRGADISFRFVWFDFFVMLCIQSRLSVLFSCVSNQLRFFNARSNKKNWQQITKRNVQSDSFARIYNNWFFHLWGWKLRCDQIKRLRKTANENCASSRKSRLTSYRK